MAVQVTQQQEFEIPHRHGPSGDDDNFIFGNKQVMSQTSTPPTRDIQDNTCSADQELKVNTTAMQAETHILNNINVATNAIADAFKVMRLFKAGQSGQDVSIVSSEEECSRRHLIIFDTVLTWIQEWVKDDSEPGTGMSKLGEFSEEIPPKEGSDCSSNSRPRSASADNKRKQPDQVERNASGEKKQRSIRSNSRTASPRIAESSMVGGVSTSDDTLLAADAMISMVPLQNNHSVETRGGPEESLSRDGKDDNSDENSEGEYQCPLSSCGEVLKTRFSLKRHMRKHTGEKPHLCPFSGCGARFPESSALKRHVRVHTGEKPFKCSHPNCGKAFADATNVKRHEMTHTGEKPYKCTVNECGRCFSRGSSLKQHMISIHRIVPDSCLISVSRGSKRRGGREEKGSQSPTRTNVRGGVKGRERSDSSDSDGSTTASVNSLSGESESLFELRTNSTESESSQDLKCIMK